MKRFTLYPFSMGLFVVLALYVGYAREASLRELLGPAAIVMALTAVLLAFTALIYRSIHRGALVAAAAIFMFLTFCEWRQGLWYLTKPLNPNQAMNDVYRLLFLQCLILVYVATVAAPRMKQPRDWTLRLNQFSLILLASPVIFWLEQTARAHWEPTLGGSGASPALLISAKPSASPDDPDIYLIVADAHGRQDVLRDMYGYDDGPFLQHLREKGFFVADASHANYAFTQLSIASMLNMRYLDEFNKIQMVTFEPVLPLLRNNTVVAILKGLGYRYITFETVFKDLCFPKSDDYIHQVGGVGVTNFQQALIDTSLLSQFGGERLKMWLTGPEPDLFHKKRQTILFELSQMPNAVKLSGPKFVFMHLLCPHTPFVFTADGSDPVQRGYGPTGEPGLTSAFTADMYRAYYSPQAQFIDGQLSGVIDEILANSAKPPIIVLISDHGPRSEVNWLTSDPKDSNLRECLSNLTAIYLPPRPGFAGSASESGGLNPSITPVNIFRIIFNDYFDTKMKLLPNKIYFSCPWIFCFHEVTDELRDGVAESPHPPSAAKLPDTRPSRNSVLGAWNNVSD
jgi:Sulfatase